MRDPDALVFDLYGTLLEVASVGRAAAAVTDDPARLVDLWRQKQLEYTWLRSLMGRYVDFWELTGDALDYTLDRLAVEVDAGGRERLLGAWLDVAPYPEVPDALARLAPRTLAVLSNGSPSMLEEGLTAGGLSKAITHVISVHELSVYKPHLTVYELAGQNLGLAPDRMLFVSSNPWDAAGARSFGLPVAWVNRAGAPMERLGVTPDLVVADLAELATVVTGR
ncbi:MAG: haloacid dehalogenase type II [Actinomycetota bacterium]|nr:haloacid dehalogenase type II [Actinomycetota bacterium]